jgi:hypothetical protein
MNDRENFTHASVFAASLLWSANVLTIWSSIEFIAASLQNKHNKKKTINSIVQHKLRKIKSVKKLLDFHRSQLYLNKKSS